MGWRFYLKQHVSQKNDAKKKSRVPDGKKRKKIQKKKTRTHVFSAQFIPIIATNDQFFGCVGYLPIQASQSVGPLFLHKGEIDVLKKKFVSPVSLIAACVWSAGRVWWGELWLASLLTSLLLCWRVGWQVCCFVGEFVGLLVRWLVSWWVCWRVCLLVFGMFVCLLVLCFVDFTYKKNCWSVQTGFKVDFWIWKNEL